MAANSPPNVGPGIHLFDSSEPGFTPIVINAAGAPAVVLGSTRDPLEDDARGFHLHGLSGALVHDLVHAFVNAKGPFAIADHL